MRFLAVVTSLAVIVAATPAFLEAQSPVTTLSGTWQRDSARSDVAMDELRQAAAPEAVRVPFTVARVEGRGPPPPRVQLPPPPAADTAGFDPNRDPVTRAATRGLLGRAALRFEPAADGVTIHFGDEPPLHFRPGRQTMVRWGLEELTVTVKLAANRIDIDTRGPDGLRVQERYELKKNGEIEVQVTSTRSGFQRAASVKYVYVRDVSG